MILPFLLAASAALFQLSPSYDADLLIACSAPLGARPERQGLMIADEAASAGDLPALRVTVEETGAFMRIHYDVASERIARARAACLGEQIVAVAQVVGDERRGAEWAGVVFTQNEGYVAPRGPGYVTRWTVAVAADGTLPLGSHILIVNSIPHEQVHNWQLRKGASLPRWVSEGHATWVERRIAPAFDPIVAAKENRFTAAAMAAMEGPPNLAGWSSVRPKREAIMRQVSEEDRARMRADPDYDPVGTFTFGPNDFEGDMTNDTANYGAANDVFEGLVARHGEEAVRAWIAALTASPGRVGVDEVAMSIKRVFGERAQDILP